MSTTKIVYLFSLFLLFVKESLVPAPWRPWDNSAETCRSYVKECNPKLPNRTSVGVTWVMYFIILHGVNNIKVTKVQFSLHINSKVSLEPIKLVL